MNRFSLRDLFWLTLVIGLAAGWWYHSRILTANYLFAINLAIWQQSILESEGYEVRVNQDGQHRAAKDGTPIVPSKKLDGIWSNHPGL
jgi:hypothetical protein